MKMFVLTCRRVAKLQMIAWGAVLETDFLFSGDDDNNNKKKNNELLFAKCTAQKIKFSIKDFFNK